MKALCWQGTKKVSVENVPDPVIENPRDVIIKVTATAICGSDLHLYLGHIPEMKDGDILGHEFMGTIIEKGKDIQNLSIGDKVVIPFMMACGNCFFCDKELYSCCDNSNRNKEKAEKVNGHSSAGMFGYSHLYGGYPGGQAEYVRVPYGDIGPFKVPNDVIDDKVLFLSDILPTAWMAVQNANIQKGDTVAIWGAGPVGLIAIKCAWLAGAGRVISIDSEIGRLKLASKDSKVETINFEDTESIFETLQSMTNGRGPDCCIDAVGMDAHGADLMTKFETFKQDVGIAKDVPLVLRQAIMACRKGGTISIPGVYAALINHFPLGVAFAKGITFKMGQTHVHKFLPELYEFIAEGTLDVTDIISHRLPLVDAEEGYKMFYNNKSECTKVVLQP